MMELVGVVSTGDIAKSYMDVYDSEYYQKREPNIGILSRHWTVQ